MDYFSSFPILKTTRLTLRELRIEDAEAVFKMRSNGMVNQFIGREAMKEMQSAAELIEKTQRAYTEKKAIAWAGILRENKEIIGTCGFNSIDFENNRAEIGGEMATEFWGKNIALEAVTAIVDFGMTQLRLNRIEAKMDAENRGAIMLAEHLGFKKEAHLRDYFYHRESYRDLTVYSLLAKDYSINNGS